MLKPKKQTEKTNNHIRFSWLSHSEICDYCTYTSKIFVQKLNISVDYLQCEKFIIIFLYCYTEI